MSTTTAGILFIGSLDRRAGPGPPPAGRLHVPGLHQRQAHRRSSGCIYRLLGVDPDAEQTLGRLRPQRAGVLGGLRPVPVRLPAAAGPPAAVAWASRRSADHIAWNTAVSFVTNTNWQSYSGESTMGHLVQMAGLAVQNFVSAAVGIAVAVALVRGFARSQHRAARQLLGRPGPDRAADPAADRVRRRDRAASPAAWCRTSPAGTTSPPSPAARRRSPAARSPARRPSRSSAPTAAASTTPTPRTRSRTRRRWTNWLEIFLLLLIPFSLPRTFGRMVGDNRQGYAIVAVMAHPGRRQRRR